MAGRGFEAHALAGFGQLAGRDALGRYAVGLEVAFQLRQRPVVTHLEGVEVHAGALGLLEDEAVVVALVQALEEGPAGPVVASHGLQAHDVGVETDGFV